MAINVIIGTFTIVIGEYIKVGFSFLTLALAGISYGPVLSGLFGAISDILNFIVRPTGPFFPGFTLSSILTGVIYGVGLYRKPITLRRLVLVNLFNMIIVSILLNTLWLNILYGKAYFVILPMRIIKALIMLPIETSLLYVVLTQYGRITKNKDIEGVALNVQKADQPR